MIARPMRPPNTCSSRAKPLDVRLPAELREQRIPRGLEHDTRLQHLTDEAGG